jgi:hypothetical protein
MEQKDHQQASGKNSSALRSGRAIHFSYPHLKQVTARDRAIENRVGRQNKSIGGLACARIPARKALAYRARL